MNWWRILSRFWLLGTLVAFAVFSIHDYKLSGWRGLKRDLPVKFGIAMLFPFILPSYNWRGWREDIGIT